jgi:hypothetical protein
MKLKAVVTVFIPNHNNSIFLEITNEFDPNALQMGEWTCSGLKPGKILKFTQILEDGKGKVVPVLN